MEKVSAMKSCKLLSGRRGVFVFLQKQARERGGASSGENKNSKMKRREDKQVESKMERRRGRRERGERGREREGERERERKLGMNGKGEEAGEEASSLPGFALLGSSQELRVTDSQTDRANSAASKGTNLSVGMGDPPPPSPPARTT